MPSARKLASSADLRAGRCLGSAIRNHLCLLNRISIAKLINIYTPSAIYAANYTIYCVFAGSDLVDSARLI